MLVVCFSLLCIALLVVPFPERAETPASEEHLAPDPPIEEFHRFSFMFEPDAYYTDVDLIIALTDAPIPHLGEKKESDIYRTLMSRSFMPRFLVLEASVNPMPYLGTYLAGKRRFSVYTPAKYRILRRWGKRKGLRPFEWVRFIPDPLHPVNRPAHKHAQAVS